MRAGEGLICKLQASYFIRSWILE